MEHSELLYIFYSYAIDVLEWVQDISINILHNMSFSEVWKENIWVHYNGLSLNAR